MSARRLDGVRVAEAIRTELAPRIARFTAMAGRPPGLGLVLAGTDPASEVYVRNKLRTAAAAGCRADLLRLDAAASLDDALAVVDRLNRDDAIDGILVQSPLPKAMGADAEQRVFDAVRPDKDVDGFHPRTSGCWSRSGPAWSPARRVASSSCSSARGLRSPAATPS